MERIKWPSPSSLPLASIFLVTFYLSEAFGKYSFWFFDEKSSVQRNIKLMILIFLVAVLLKKHLKPLLLLGGLALSFILGQLFLSHGFLPDVLVNSGKYMFPILLFLFFSKYPSGQDHQHLFFKTFEIVILCNSLLILLGFLFGIALFSTYAGERFGYNGLFFASSTGSYVYIIAVFYFLFTLKQDFFRNWKTLIFLPAAFLLGTKTVLAGILAAIFLWLWYYAGFSKTRKRIVLSVFFVALLGGAYLFFFEFGIFNEIRQERGLVDAIFSFRNDLLFHRTLPFIENNWNFGNYLFGGINDLQTKSQMGIVDIFYFWGLFGGVFYLLLYGRIFVDFPLKNPILFCLAIIFGLAFFAGHFFVNASLAIYLLALRERWISNTFPPTDLGVQKE